MLTQKRLVQYFNFTYDMSMSLFIPTYLVIGIGLLRMLASELGQSETVVPLCKVGFV